MPSGVGLARMAKITTVTKASKITTFADLRRTADLGHWADALVCPYGMGTMRFAYKYNWNIFVFSFIAFCFQFFVVSSWLN